MKRFANLPILIFGITKEGDINGGVGLFHLPLSLYWNGKTASCF